MIVKARIEDYEIQRFVNRRKEIFPYVKDVDGNYYMTIISPQHGRSFLLQRINDQHWIIGKGNGLSYSTYTYLFTSQHDTDTWGGLSLKDALRDFDIGMEINSLGIKTNKMEFVLELPFNTVFRGIREKAGLLQYSVECPYRISDYAFIPSSILKKSISTWYKNENGKPLHLQAAKILFSNLKILHDNKILHNAINIQNYTWALELVDFEASHTPQIPYGSMTYQSYIPMISEMEILQTYEIVYYIAWCIGESPNYNEIQKIIKSFGFKLDK